jgi:hypothetical protein
MQTIKWSHFLTKYEINEHDSIIETVPFGSRRPLKRGELIQIDWSKTRWYRLLKRLTEKVVLSFSFDWGKKVLYGRFSFPKWIRNLHFSAFHSDRFWFTDLHFTNKVFHEGWSRRSDSSIRGLRHLPGWDLCESPHWSQPIFTSSPFLSRQWHPAMHSASWATKESHPRDSWFHRHPQSLVDTSLVDLSSEIWLRFGTPLEFRPLDHSKN